jgi:hypothetical protein
MTAHDENMRKLERALTEAHRARRAPLLGQGWAEQIMRDIRHVGVPQPKSPRGIEHLVWQTAAIAAALALIVTISVVAWSQAPSKDGIGLLTEEFESAPLFFE